MNRRRSTSIAGSPLLIGAVTTLIVLVTVFLSYNANNGLPFTPTYDIKVELSKAGGLQPGNQVRVAGTRVGVVSSMEPRQDPATGRLAAIAHLKLEKGLEPLPVDTTARLRLATAIGLEYLELEKGHSTRGLKAGQTLPVSQTRETIEIDQLFNTFDKKTRTANQQNLTTFGNAFVGRGVGLNETIAQLPSTLAHALPVLRNLASPQTGLRQLFIALDRSASEVAPVANAQAGLFRDLDRLFAAWASVAPSLEATIEGGPPALRQAIHSLPFEASFLEKATEFARLLRPAARALRASAGPLGHALAAGAVNLRAAVALNPRLAEATQAFSAFGQDPVVENGIEDLAHTLSLGNPLLAGLTPAQTNCNYVTLAFRNIASLLSESIGVGTVARAALVLAPTGPNSEGLPSSAPANGPSVEKASTTGTAIVDNNHLHVNPYPYVGGPGQPHVCEAGNQVYVPGKAVIGNVPGTTSAVHEGTTRSQDLFGRTYSAQTLVDLGVTRSSATAKHSPATKKSKGKRK